MWGPSAVIPSLGSVGPASIFGGRFAAYYLEVSTGLDGCYVNETAFRTAANDFVLVEHYCDRYCRHAKVDARLKCPKTSEVMRDTVATNWHVYEKGMIKQRFQRGNRVSSQNGELFWTPNFGWK